jgi:FtsP/CotA-like multicopper oxidase with cupredoxin domain
MSMTHLCRETLVTVVNGQLPGPTIEATEGDSVTVHVVNQSPHNMTIHWYVVHYVTYQKTVLITPHVQLYIQISF